MPICFVLVDPVVPENVGFCARGLNTMGYDDLRIVGEPIHEKSGARTTGYGSHDLLDNVKVFSSLKDAVSDCDLVVGTTAKQRVTRYDYLSPEQLGINLAAKTSDISVALVFGSETNGLSKKEIATCDLLSSIPLRTTYPSLNLAQAVLVYAYELSKPNETSSRKPSSEGLIRSVKAEAGELLTQLGYQRHPIQKQRILDRLMQLDEQDFELVLGVMKRLKRIKG